MNARALPEELRAWLLGALLWIGAAVAIGMPNLQRLHPLDLDSRWYAAMSRGEVVHSPFQHRRLVPAMAQLIPDGVVAALSQRSAREPEWVALAKLTLVSMAFLVLTSAVLFGILQRVGFDPWHALAGSLLFLTCPTVVRFGASPLVDSASWFFISACALAILERRWTVLGVAFAIGMFAKESLAIVAAFVLLAPLERDEKLKACLALAPGALLALGIRWSFREGDPNDEAGWIPVQAPHLPTAEDVAHLLSPHRLKELVLAFGPLWILAPLGLAAVPREHALRRWCWTLAILAVLMVTMQIGVQRVAFLAFPAIVPLALHGALRWMRRA